MSALDTCSLKKSLPLLIALLVVAQIDLASAARLAEFALVAAASDGGARRPVPGNLHGAGLFIDVLASSNSPASLPNALCKPRDPRHD